MTTAVNNSSSATVYLDSGQHHLRYFSLTTDEATQKAMPPSQHQLPAPVTTSGAWTQQRAPISPSSTFSAEPSMPWLAPSRPPLAIALQPRALTERNIDSELILSPLSQRSRQSPDSRAFSSRRPSYENSPFSSSLSDTHERLRLPDLSIGHPARYGPPAGPAQTTLQTMRSSEPQIRDHGTSRFHLHIRQQPRAARAGPDGKDRRAIDPPPILQLMIDDFNPDLPEDLEEIESSFWVVHCRLVAAFDQETDMSTQSHFTEDGRREVQRLLLGSTVASPHQTLDDPDPPSMIAHRITRPPSPTALVLPYLPDASPRRQPREFPGAFFIFADISVRKAGEYKLQFTLMKMEPAFLVTNAMVPAVDVVTSDPFRAVNAKDFDQVQPSSPLVKGLIERGAGFPLKLKKGQREGQGRKRPHSEESDGHGSGDRGTLHS